MGEIRIVSPGKTCGYPYLVCKKISYTFFLVRDAIRLSFSTNRSVNQVQSTLVISKSKGPTETLRDIRT